MANKNVNGDVNVSFTEAASRQSLESGESVKTLFGKLRKWLSDLKPVAFSGSYNDLTDKPDIPSNDKVIYGMHFYNNTSNIINGYTCLNYIADATGKRPAHINNDGTFDYGDWEDAFFMPRPCMLKYDGTVDYYLDKNDYSKKEDGSDSDISNSSYEGNAMMEFPLIYVWYNQYNNDLYIANYKVDDNFDCPCNKDCDGNIIPFFYMAIYPGTGINKLRSLSGIAQLDSNGGKNISYNQATTRARNNNINAEQVEWDIDNKNDFLMIMRLLYLIGKSYTIVGYFGRGYGDLNSHITGAGNQKGLFTGYNDRDGEPLKIFGIENYWGNFSRYTQLISMSGTYIVKSMSNGISYVGSGSYSASSYSWMEGSNVAGRYFDMYIVIASDSYTKTASFFGRTIKDQRYDGGSTLFNCREYFCLEQLAENKKDNTNTYVGAALSCKPHLSKFNLLQTEGE